MAALRGTIHSDRSTVTRLSHRRLNVHADTWDTFATVELDKDGSGALTVKQNGRTILTASWSAEAERAWSAATLADTLTHEGRVQE